MKSPIFHRMFDYDRSLLPNRHLALLEENVRTIEEARERTGATIGYPGWGIIYHILLSHLDRLRSEVILETGTNWGCSTIILAQALIDAKCEGRVLSVELDPDNAAIAKKNLEAAGVAERVEIHVGDSRAVLPELLENQYDVRFAFLDSSHLFDHVMAEFSSVVPKLTDDALVVFDNTYQIAEQGEDPRVNGALRAITDQYGGNLVNLEFVSWYTPGLAIWQRNGLS